MLGATALIPLLIVPAMGGTPTQKAEVICTIFFVSGCNTLLQTTIGDRLPIVQGGMGVGVSGHQLAGTVARWGGVGTLSSVDLRRHRWRRSGPAPRPS